MNNSGKAIRYWLNELKIPIENLLVISDDIALPFGRIRMRNKGSDGGHNGLSSIIENTNTQEFSRLRFGIGAEFGKGQQIDYVLGKWSEDEEQRLPERLKVIIGAIKSFSTIGLQRTMNEFNNK